jgi:hypothetical protein
MSYPSQLPRLEIFVVSTQCPGIGLSVHLCRPQSPTMQEPHWISHGPLSAWPRWMAINGHSQRFWIIRCLFICSLCLGLMLAGQWRRRTWDLCSLLLFGTCASQTLVGRHQFMNQGHTATVLLVLETT